MVSPLRPSEKFGVRCHDLRLAVRAFAFADGDTVWERNEFSATLEDPSPDSHAVSCGHGNEKTAEGMKRSYSGRHHREDGPLFISAESLDSIVSAGV